MAVEAPRARVGAVRRIGRRRRALASLKNYLFVAPAAIFLLGLLVYPVVYNVIIAFQDLRAINLLSGGAEWVGFDNYREIFADRSFREAAGNSLIFTGFSLVFQFVIGLALALFYNQPFPGSRWMRGLFLIAWAVPVVATGAIFRWLLDGDFGVINWVLRTIGLLEGNIDWLTEPDRALAALIFVNVWLGIPFNMILILAGLQGIPSGLYEAAAIDGAGRWKRFWHITLPLLRPALLAVIMLGLIYTFKVFDLIWVTTRGGPLESTEVLPTLSYKLVFQQFRFGTGAAVLNVLFVALFLVSLVYLWTVRREEREI